MTTQPDTFASRLHRLMNDKGFNQTSLANESSLERTVINRMVKGRRHPSPFEIGVLAKSLQITPEDLMDGVDLPPQVQRAVDKERERTERVLAAEATRDEAIARANQLAVELERVQCEREREQEDARKTQEAAEATWRERLQKAEASHAAQSRVFESRIDAYKGMVERAAAKIREYEATQIILRNQITVLQQQVAHERSTKAGASVLGGLVGIALGRAMD